MTVDLSERLAAVLDAVGECDTLVDVAADHAWLSISAVSAGRAKRALAVDLHPATQAQARTNCAIAGVADRVELVLGNGLEPVAARAFDAVAMAGIGGALAVRILVRAGDALTAAKRLVVQPNTEPEAVRAWAYESGWHLADERLVEERGRTYAVLAFERGIGADPAYEGHRVPVAELWHLGPLLVRRADPTALRHFAQQLDRLRQHGRAHERIASLEAVLRDAG